jgi:hypothetical protein
MVKTHRGPRQGAVACRLAERQEGGVKKSTTRRDTQARRREQELGDFGEDRALELLSNNGFTVEKMPRNFPFFDLMAKRDGRHFLVPVKTRNKFKPNGKLRKNTYNLYTKAGHLESVEKIANFFGLEIHWVAVTVDSRAKTSSACMGDASEIPAQNGRKYIPMHPTRDVARHRRLVIDEHDDAIKGSWINITERN